MLSDIDRRPSIGNTEQSFGDEMEKEIGLLLREQRREDYDDRERELNIYRSGSAPPTVEGSLNAVVGLSNHGASDGSGISNVARDKGVNGFISEEEEFRSDPDYPSYYYANVNLNPRLPPPLLSKEDWRSAQRFQGGSSAIGDRRKVNRNDSGSGGRSLASMPPGFNPKSQGSPNESTEVQGSVDWGGAGLIGLPGLGLGSKQKSLAEIFQGDLGRAQSASGQPSRPVSRNALYQTSDSLGSLEADASSLHLELTSADPVHTTINIEGSSGAQHGGQPASYSYAAALGNSLSRSTTPDPQHIARAPSPGLAPIGGGRVGYSEKRNINSPNSLNGVSSHTNDTAELVAALSGMHLSNGLGNEENHSSSTIGQDRDDQNSYLFGLAGHHTNSKQHPYLKSGSGINSSNMLDLGHSSFQTDHRKTTVLRNNSYRTGSSTSVVNGAGGLFSQYQQLDSPNSSPSNYNVNGYSVNSLNLPPLFENAAVASAMGLSGMESRMLGGSNISSHASEHSLRVGNQTVGSGLQSHYMDPAYLQYLRNAEILAGQVAALNNPSMDRNYMGNPYADLLQKAYLGGMMSPQKAAYGDPADSKHNHHGFYSNPAFGIGLSYPGSPLASPVPNSPVAPGSPMRLGDFGMRYPGGMRNITGGVLGPWHLEGVDNNFASSLLEEFKINKTKCFELSEIVGHVVEFSADQYGSRFIQQKLETATIEEKNMVFDEINPQSLTLMTDVFGNYVIQKFFEHGMPSQRRELCSKLFDNVLSLSLQMYGCRVIQKAIEVVDVDQKIQMVKELDGHIMRCVRDQNGNHVIQKCIECVPEEHIQFIVSTFFGQVVTLSTHPYGCRVVQRVLEHCSDPKTQSIVMEEILGSVSMLAQDQYGNYVIQHILEHGKPQERSTIVQELAGRIVQMSQQKFASNVVEKCLTFGDPSERQLLVNEILGTTDENEPLQAMMKDQFANYVVQKVLETCSDQQRELILTRIKVHLNALKKYTYGKHIVARVEKLVAAGERRIAQSTYSAA